MLPNNVKSKDMVGKWVKTAHAIKNGAGICIPKGAAVKIVSMGRSFTIRSRECPRCGLSAMISNVTRNDVELLKDSDGKDVFLNKELIVLERENGWYGGYEKDEEGGGYVQLFNSSARDLFMSMKFYADKGYLPVFVDKKGEAEFMKDRPTLQDYVKNVMPDEA